MKLKDPPGKIGNIHVPDAAKDGMRHLAFTVQVLELGPLCYRGDKFGELQTNPPWANPGDWVLTSAYAGTRFLVDGHEYRIINDDEIQGLVPDPDAIKRAG